MGVLMVWRGPRGLASFSELGATIGPQRDGGFNDEPLPPDAAAELGSNKACETEVAIASKKAC